MKKEYIQDVKLLLWCLKHEKGICCKQWDFTMLQLDISVTFRSIYEMVLLVIRSFKNQHISFSGYI